MPAAPSVSALSGFEALSRATGIALPPLLHALLASGNTTYFPQWFDAWNDPEQPRVVPFLSWWDYEWIDAEESARGIAGWLHPEAQEGRRFLPFAQSGAGDLYCLVPDDAGNVGVALAWHDDDRCEIGHRTFDDFVYAQYLQTLSDASHLADDYGDLTAEAIATDIRSVSGLMDPRRGERLRQLCQRPLVLHDVRRGPRACVEQVPAFISQQELEGYLAELAEPLPPFTITMRYEMAACDHGNAAPPTPTPTPPPPPDWRELAKQPGTKMLAIRTYQQECACTLAEAKQAIDDFLASARENRLP
jgi:hypothetical protein